MKTTDLHLRIYNLCCHLDTIMELILSGLKDKKADQQLVSELIRYQLDTYAEVRLLFEQLCEVKPALLERYDMLLHQLHMYYMLLECGVKRIGD